MENLKRNGFLIVEAIFLSALFLFALVLDGASAVSLSWQFYLAMGFSALLLTLPSFLSSQRKQTLWLFLSFSFGLFTLHFLPVSPVKPFMRFHRDIGNGMATQEVQYLFSQHFPKDGRFRQPRLSLGVGIPFDARYGADVTDTPTQSFHYILDPTDGRFNSETLTVYFKNGRVVGTEYLSD